MSNRIENRFYRANDRSIPIRMGTRIRHALFASTLTTSELVVIVFTMSMLLMLFELFKLLMTSLISLSCELSIFIFKFENIQYRN